MKKKLTNDSIYVFVEYGFNPLKNLNTRQDLHKIYDTSEVDSILENMFIVYNSYLYSMLEMKKRIMEFKNNG